MILTKQEHIHHRTISGSIAILMVGSLLLFFILYHLTTSNPPFPISSNNNTEVSFALVEAGSDHINYDQIGAAPTIVSSDTKAFLADEKSEFRINDHPLKNENKLSEKKLVQKLAEKYKKRSFKNNSGIGNYSEAGQQGDPNGDPNSNDHYRSDGNNIKNIENQFTFDLKGSMIVKAPHFPKDTQEEGKVVVNIIVDSEGSVSDAQANGRGTTTSSAILKAKARQLALATKFNADSKNFERRGSITIIFAFE